MSVFDLDSVESGRLAPAQITARAKEICRLLDALHIEDRTKVLLQAGLVEANVENVEAYARFKMMESLDRDNPDPRVIDLALEQGQRKTSEDWGEDLQIEIVPYEVKDTSLARIAEQCSEDPYMEMLKAICRRYKTQRANEAAKVKSMYTKMHAVLSGASDAAEDSGNQ